MKRFTAVIIVITGLLAGGRLLSQNNNAAPPMGHNGMHGQTPEERFNKLSEELNLSEDQKAKVQSTFEETRQKIQAAIIEARSNADAQLQQVLSPEQYQKLQNLWQQHEHHWGGGGANTNQPSGQ